VIRLAFLASNNGTAMRAVTKAVERKQLHARVCLVVSNKPDSPSLAFARDHSIPALHIPTRGVEETADASLLQALTDERIDLLVLSGYLRKLGSQTLSAFHGRILNLHPALLPKFGGKGMYGRRVHEAVLLAKETVSGATVHLVDPEYDEGRIVASSYVAIVPGEDAASLERKVIELECSLLVDTLRRIAEGRLTLPL